MEKKRKGREDQNMKGDKMKVKLGTVQETMLIPLVIKASKTQRPRARIHGKEAVEILEQSELDTDKYDKFMSHEGVVARTIMSDRTLKSYLQQYPGAVCVNPSCGLGSRFPRVDSGGILWYDIDLPDVIAVRKQFFQEEGRVRLIEGSILEPDWTRPVKKGRKVVFIAEGILMYFTREQVKAPLGVISQGLADYTLLAELIPLAVARMSKHHDTVKNTGAAFSQGVNSGEELEQLCLGLKLIKEGSFNDVMKGFTFQGWLTGTLPKIKDMNDRLAVSQYGQQGVVPIYRNGAGEYISRFLGESKAGSAGEVFSRIPPEIGRCKIWERRTEQRVSAMGWEMYYEQDIWVQKNKRLPMNAAQMTFFLNQGLAWEMGEPTHRVRMERGEACIYRDTLLPSSTWYQGGVGFRFKSIQMPRECFQYIVQGHLGMKEMDLSDRTLRSFTKITITPYMYRLLQELEQVDQFCDGIGVIYLEGEILEMIAAYLDSCLDMGGGSGGVTGSRTDREVILEIRHRVDRDSANVPDCGILAGEAGTSVSKLTKGFRELSGKPLHAYVIDRRLEYAAFLLAGNRLNVSQAAIYVGYSNMSYFSAAFRKKYGVLPKDYIKGHWEE